MDWPKIKHLQNEVRYCPVSGKVRYDKRGAQTVKNKRYQEAHIKLRIYECPECRSWHLTSKL